MILSKEKRGRIVTAVIVTIVVTVLIYYRYHFYYFLLRLFTPRSKNDSNNAIIRDLHPLFAFRVGRFVKQLERSGKTVKLTSGYRSPSKQEQLYNSGQTPAQPLSSYHNYGLAVDMNVDGLKMASSYNDWLPVANIAKDQYNFRWGGDFANNWDKVHFDDGNRFNIEQLKNLYLNKQIVNGKYPKIL